MISEVNSKSLKKNEGFDKSKTYLADFKGVLTLCKTISKDNQEIILKFNLNGLMPCDRFMFNPSQLRTFLNNFKGSRIIESDNLKNKTEKASTRFGFSPKRVERINDWESKNISNNYNLFVPICLAEKLILNINNLRFKSPYFIPPCNKNLFGLLSNENKNIFHSNIKEVITLVSSQFKNVFNIINISNIQSNIEIRQPEFLLGFKGQKFLCGFDQNKVDKEILDLFNLKTDYFC